MPNTDPSNMPEGSAVLALVRTDSLLYAPLAAATHPLARHLQSHDLGHCGNSVSILCHNQVVPHTNDLSPKVTPDDLSQFLVLQVQLVSILPSAMLPQINRYILD